MDYQLQNGRITRSCQQDWEQMRGSNTVRYCDECNKSVHNLSAMSRREAEALIASKQGSLCARIVYRRDGSIKTVEPVSPWRNAMARAAMLFGLTTAPLAVHAPAQLVRVQPADPGCESAASGAAKASITGVVKDITGAGIAGAEVAVEGPERRFLRTDGEGVFTAEGLTAGSYRVKIQSAGFRASHYQRCLRSGGTERLQSELEVPMLGEFIIVSPPRKGSLLHRLSELPLIARLRERD